MSDIADDVRRVFADPGAVAERLQASRLAASAQPMRDGDDPVVAATQRERRRAVGAGINGLRKLADGRDAELSDAERFGLRAIVQLEARPALLVQDGDFAEPPPEWARLARHRERIREVIARSGRVEVAGHVELDWIGTASLVAPRTLMTNRHVAREFSLRDGAGFAFRPRMTSRIDFRREHGRPSALEFEITDVIGWHEDHDLALLRVEGTSRDGRPLPEPLAIAAVEPPDLFARDVYVVGYPAYDGRRNEPEPIRRIFMDLYNVKRLQPGRARGYSAMYKALEHDCSTLGGNSGSPVIDLETHQVIGLHFGGRFGAANYAVPLWTLRDDPLLRSGRVNFQ